MIYIKMAINKLFDYRYARFGKWSGLLHFGMSCSGSIRGIQSDIPAKLLRNRDTVSVHFNHFHYIEICDKLSRKLSILNYIYLNVD